MSCVTPSRSSPANMFDMLKRQMAGDGCARAICGQSCEDAKGQNPLPRASFWISVVFLTIFSAIHVSAAPTPQEVKAQLAITDTSLGIQSSFPGPKAAPAEQKFVLSERFADAFLWTAIILGGGALAFVLRDILPGGYARRAAWQVLDDADAAAAVASRDDVASTADDLARLGRFNEAVHLLLLTSLADLRRKLDTTFADSLTSREILRHVTLSDDGKVAFAALVGRVEPLHFGDRVADAADYAACRNSFDHLTAALAAGSKP